MLQKIRQLLRIVFHGSCKTKCDFPACTKPLCVIQTLREKIAKSERKVLTLHIDRYADYATRTRLNKVKELFEKEGTKVVIKTR